MSRKDYVRLASAMKIAIERSYMTPEQKMAVHEAATQVAWECNHDNPNFSFDRFFEYIGVPVDAKEYHKQLFGEEAV